MPDAPPIDLPTPDASTRSDAIVVISGDGSTHTPSPNITVVTNEPEDSTETDADMTLTPTHPGFDHVRSSTPHRAEPPSLSLVASITESTGASNPPDLSSRDQPNKSKQPKQFVCHLCNRKCASKAGLQSHLRAHKRYDS